MEPSADISLIVLKYVREETLSPDERVQLTNWIGRNQERQDWLERLKRDPDYTQTEVARLQNVNVERIWSKIKGLQPDLSTADVETATSPLIPIINHTGRRWQTYLAAASVILIICAGGARLWLFPSHPATPSAPAPPAAIASDVQPGSNKAILTLADGRRIDLDTSSNGVLTHQGNTKISKLADGQLAYNKVKISDDQPQATVYNSLSTPRSGQFALRLPDGSRVWLNNASTIRYPIAFAGPDRTVEIAGEAYFEIAKDAAHPFRVIVHRNPKADIANLAPNAAPISDEGGAIEVLGTSFNVMAYSDEPAERTTLIDGSIRFTLNGAGALLHPDEQSVLDEQGNLHILPKVNVDEVTAWKNGYFHFDHANFQATMRQLARWYDINVTYQVQPTGQEFNGRIERGLPLSVILKELENEHVHFKLEGREVTVMP